MDTQLLQYKPKESINYQQQISTKNPTTMIKDQTTLPIINHFSILESEQTVSMETTNDLINNKLRTINNNACEHLSSQNKDIDMLDNNVSSKKKLMKKKEIRPYKIAPKRTKITLILIITRLTLLTILTKNLAIILS